MVIEYVEDISEPSKTSETLEKKDADDSLGKEVDEYLVKFLDMSNEAKDNDNHEKKMSLAEGLRTFPKAAMWSISLSSALIMQGYDNNLLGSLYAFPDFQEKFGRYYESQGGYQVPAKWQTSLSMGNYVGEVFGLFIAGIFAERHGYRYTLIGALIFTIGFIFIVFFATSVQMLLAGEILLGVVWGACQTLTVNYASEVCPLVLRLYLTTYVNMCWVIGQLVSSGVLRGLLNSNINESYKVAFGLQWAWPVPIILCVWLAPESPWWLARKGRHKEAKKAIIRLLTEHKGLPDKSTLADAMLSKIQVTINQESTLDSVASYMDCFKGRDLRRTRITAMVWLVQNITGSALMGNSTYFYVQAGLSNSYSFTFSIIQYVLGIIGTISSWLLSQKAGRFQIYFYGLLANSVILLVVGGLGCSSNSQIGYGVGSLLLVFTFIYDFTVGPLCYCMVTEIPSTRLRTKTIIIARCVYNIAGIVVSLITPYMLNPTAWNWKAKTGFFWAGFAISCAAWCYFDLPETKGRTYAELDRLFEEQVPARKFKYTEIEGINANKMVEKLGEEGIKQMVEIKDQTRDPASA